MAMMELCPLWSKSCEKKRRNFFSEALFHACFQASKPSISNQNCFVQYFYNTMKQHWSASIHHKWGLYSLLYRVQNGLK